MSSNSMENSTISIKMCDEPVLNGVSKKQCGECWKLSLYTIVNRALPHGGARPFGFSIMVASSRPVARVLSPGWYDSHTEKHSWRFLGSIHKPPKGPIWFGINVVSFQALTGPRS